MVSTKIESKWIKEAKVVFVNVKGKWRWVIPPLLEERDIVKRRANKYIRHRLKELPVKVPSVTIDYPSKLTHDRASLFSVEVEIGIKETEFFNRHNVKQTLGKLITSYLKEFDDPNLE